jgi:hypothetical protein
VEEDESQAEKPFFPKARTERVAGTLQNQSVYARMAELLRNRGDEEEYRRIEWMAVPQNPDVHLEDVEETEVEDEVSDETGHTGILCTHGGE